MTVEIGGYQITILSNKKCWRVNVVYSCGHPVLMISKIRYPGCDKDLVVELNPHGTPCTVKGRAEKLIHELEDLYKKCKKVGSDQVGTGVLAEAAEGSEEP